MKGFVFEQKRKAQINPIAYCFACPKGTCDALLFLCCQRL